MYMLVVWTEKNNGTNETLERFISEDKDSLREEMRKSILEIVEQEERFYTGKLSVCHDRPGLEREVRRRIARCREDAKDIRAFDFNSGDVFMSGDSIALGGRAAHWNTIRHKIVNLGSVFRK